MPRVLAGSAQGWMESLFSPADVTQDSHGRTGSCHGDKLVGGTITEGPPAPEVEDFNLQMRSCFLMSLTKKESAICEHGFRLVL